MSRPLRMQDFPTPGTVVPATYNGRSSFLVKGKTYNVTLASNGKVTVKQTLNPDIFTNGGVQFIMSTFLVKESNMSLVKFEDLSAEDQERLLQKAREIVDEENIKRDAFAAYKAKKKELMTRTIEELYANMKIKHIPEKNALKSRYVSLVNYLFKMRMVNVYAYRSDLPNYIIGTATEWEEFVACNDAAKDIFIRLCRGA